MRVFLTGATGFVGSAIVPELLAGGHEVLGLSRSDEGDRALRAAGAEAHRGDLEDAKSLRRGAARADAVIHCAFDHDFSRHAENVAIEAEAVADLAAELWRSDRPLVLTSGLASPAGVRPITEDAETPEDAPGARRAERIGLPELWHGVRISVVRLPQVHDAVKQGLVTPLIGLARDWGASAYVGDGENRWPAAHVRDVARLYRLALEKREIWARYHAVAEEGIPFRVIAETIGRGLGLPVISIPAEDADAHFGFLARFAGGDLSASSALTRQRLGWHPAGCGLVEDLEAHFRGTASP